MSVYLITGGAGFIGSNLVDALVQRGDDVRVIDDLSSGKLSNLSHVIDSIEFVEGDIWILGAAISLLFHKIIKS